MSIPPVRAVLFDLHGTLVDQGSSHDWLALAVASTGQTAARPGAVDDVDPLISFLDRIWEHAREHDPDSERDLSPHRHREVFDATMRQAPGVDPALVDALYDTLLDPWVAYADAAPVLRSLRAAGISTALVSNVGVDVWPVLVREGLAGLLDVVVTSHEVGAVKPDLRIFATVLERLGVPGGAALMVGDTPGDDAGGGPLGVRTLVLPRTRGPVHGLHLVTRLCGLPDPGDR